ncbi:hypothetical protein [Pandoraea sp.]|uniref:hypothetical protein n=1 Tax=Pandoraea sp. TaxID=1883445 RepID=UPI00120E1AFA|nr:hypothetical protein [Pandoraea sp.]TAL53384.1 MAG: RHS repeat protein [Pandoraea sp.]TAM20474.1 MAG: RHS repeat protein [Pandoraea sp.]
MSIHTHTPSVTALDGRGQAVRTIAYHRREADEKPEARVTRHVFDEAGRLVSSIDPRLFARAEQGERVTPNMQYAYALGGQVLRTDSVDAGWRVEFFNDAGQVMLAWDSRGARRRVQYDALQRPVAIYERPGAAGAREQCVERLAYGDRAATHNRRGQLLRHDDPAGTRTLGGYGLSGKILGETRRFLASPDAPDWPADVAARDALLEAEAYTTRWRYNVAGAMISQTDACGNEQVFTHNVAGQLKTCTVHLAAMEETVGRGKARRTQMLPAQTQKIVTSVVYDANGQAIREDAGNGVRTTRTYRTTDQRLLRIHAQRADGTVLQDLHYEYDPVGNVTRMEDKSQPVTHFRNQRVTPVCTYRYDTLYQLIEATGRESAHAGRQGAALPPPLPITPDAGQLVNYRRRYEYDAGNNLVKIRHHGAMQYTQEMVVAPDSNRAVPQWDGVTPATVDRFFDANGNLLQLAPGQPLSWNARNQLESVVLAGNHDDQ